MGDFIPQTPSLGPCPQTPSSLRAYRSFLSENSINYILIPGIPIVIVIHTKPDESAHKHRQQKRTE